MKSALQWTQQVCSGQTVFEQKPVTLLPEDVTALALCVQGDTAQWAAGLFRDHPFEVAHCLLRTFAAQAAEAAQSSKIHEN